MKKPLILPKFKNEDEEHEFWANINLADYYEPSDGQSVSFPNLKPSTRTISLRLPQGLLTHLKVLANQQDVPYQSLMKMFLAERVRLELRERAKDYNLRQNKEQKDSDEEPTQVPNSSS
ncbi:MAG TPA: BrnA antitoxin family protein [Patescibacteria group bacterium]